MVQNDLVSKIRANEVAIILEHFTTGHRSSPDVFLPFPFIRIELSFKLSAVDVLLSLSVEIDHQILSVFESLLPNFVNGLRVIKL